jgi:hypothetical protein
MANPSHPHGFSVHNLKVNRYLNSRHMAIPSHQHGSSVHNLKVMSLLINVKVRGLLQSKFINMNGYLYSTPVPIFILLFVFSDRCLTK